MGATLAKYQLHRPALAVITSDTQLDEYTNKLIELEEQDHPSSDDKKYARVLAVLIETYENERYPIAAATPLEVLHELKEQNGLRQRDFIPLLGTESVVSEIMNGKRELSKTHIERLSQRFRVSPAVFFKQPQVHRAR